MLPYLQLKQQESYGNAGKLETVLSHHDVVSKMSLPIPIQIRYLFSSNLPLTRTFRSPAKRSNNCGIFPSTPNCRCTVTFCNNYNTLRDSLLPQSLSKLSPFCSPAASNMTTISTRSTLSTSLARTKKVGCATEAHRSKEHRRSQRLHRDDDDDDDAVLHGGVDEFEDEEIASVEADGVVEAPLDDGDTTKRELTAALVSSIVESAALSGGGGGGKVSNNDKTNANEKDESDAEISLGKRKFLSGDEQEVRKEDVVSKLPCEDDSSAQHVTPPASASSSFSSIEATETNHIASDCAARSNDRTKSSSPSGGRTMYQRASKSVATEKVTSTLAPALKPNPQLLTATSDENITQPSPSLLPEPKKRRLDTDLKTTSNAVVNGRANASAAGTRTKAGNKQAKSPKTLTAQAKAAQGMVPLRTLAPIYAGGMKPVPNPLAGKEDTPARASPVNPNASTPNTSNKKCSNRSSVTKKTKTLMSAAPNAVVPGSGPPSRNQSSTQLDAVVPEHQEVGSAVDLNPLARGRIFSMDLDPSVLDFVGSVVDDHNNEKNVSFKGDVADNAMSNSFRRDRGFSFEFFSFGIDANEDLPPIPDSLVGSMPSGNRLRGDSIIFDPTSFCDGGIHEESALMHTTQQEISADPVSSQQSIVVASSSAQPRPAAPKVRPTSSGRRPKPSFKVASAAEPVVSQGTVPSEQVKQTKPSTKGGKLSQSPIKYTKTTSKGGAATRTVNASRPFPQALTENTIHMPHGSDAAAAAAAGLPEPADASQGDGFSLSHTACPMDLLNKGGRIGIYLPEERKARIAKFHSKRRSRIWRKRIKYDCRKKLADSRPRIKGRFVKRSDVDGEDYSP